MIKFRTWTDGFADNEGLLKIHFLFGNPTNWYFAERALVVSSMVCTPLIYYQIHKLIPFQNGLQYAVAAWLPIVIFPQLVFSKSVYISYLNTAHRVEAPTFRRPSSRSSDF
jgi:hypothetical protein